MAQIIINEVSSNYGFNPGANSYATVALPITASWGPGYNAATPGDAAALEEATWIRYPSNQGGLENFMATYRGPATNYRLSKDYSYQIALTLLNAGYDVLVCRLCPGLKASGTINEVAQYTVLSSQPDDWATNYSDYFTKSGTTYTPVESVDSYVDIHNENKPADWDEAWNTYYTTDGESNYIPNEESTWTTAKAQTGGLYRKDEIAPTFVVDTFYKLVDSGNDKIDFTAKYAGSFGNNLQVSLTKKAYTISGVVTPYWNMIVYVVDSMGVKTAVENKVFVMEVAHSTDELLHWSEIESKFVTINASETCTDDMVLDNSVVTLTGGTDRAAESDGDTVSSVLRNASELAAARYGAVDEVGTYYISAIEEATTTDLTKAYNIRYMEWLYTAAVGIDAKVGGVYSLLNDKLTYNPNRIISPGWDDQNYGELGSEGPETVAQWEISPLHVTLMDCAYFSRCATSFIDIPKSLKRGGVYEDPGSTEGYAQKLARYTPNISNVNSLVYSSHSALFAPWGQYTYSGTNKQTTASPSFIALMIQRAQILNQALQYEWALPTNRKHGLKLGKLDYNVPKKLLDIWQTLEGVGVNVIAQIPDLGTNIWGNSTLYEVPPATYQALANLSTRFLVNAIEDVVYKVGISITFQYNNSEAYSSFYAGVSPILDTMKSVGAIDDYRIEMSADINGLDSVNANSVLGKIWLTINGIINDISVDLIALPPSVDLSTIVG